MNERKTSVEMKQEKINRAFPSLARLKDIRLPVKKAYAVYKLYMAAEGAYRFAAEEEKKCLDEYNGTIVENGEIRFESPEKCAAFMERLEEIHNMDVDFCVEPVVLTEQDLGDQTLTPGDFYNLEGFVTFE